MVSRGDGWLNHKPVSESVFIPSALESPCIHKPDVWETTMYKGSATITGWMSHSFRDPARVFVVQPTIVQDELTEK